MIYQSRTSATAKRYTVAKQRIRKGQKRAKRIGFIYLLATFALVALACLPLMQVNDGLSTHDMGVMSFYGVFTQLSGGPKGKEMALLIALLYSLMLVTVAISALKTLGKIRWLRKKKASRTYGFNRPMYAMDDLSRIFTRVFTSIVVTHLAIACLAQSVTFSTLAYVAVGVGVAVHLLCGIATLKVGLFDIEDGFSEQKRTYRKFGSLFRNLVQVAACGAMGWAFFKSGALSASILEIARNFNAYLADPMKMLVPALEIAAFLVWAGMVKYAVSDVEFDIDGRQAAGRKRFFVLALLAVACMGGAVMVAQFMLNAPLSVETILVSDIALVALVAEILLCWAPRRVKSKKKIQQKKQAKLEKKAKKANKKKVKEDIDPQVFLQELYRQPQTSFVDDESEDEE